MMSLCVVYTNTSTWTLFFLFVSFSLHFPRWIDYHRVNYKWFEFLIYMVWCLISNYTTDLFLYGGQSSLLAETYVALHQNHGKVKTSHRQTRTKLLGLQAAHDIMQKKVQSCIAFSVDIYAVSDHLWAYRLFLHKQTWTVVVPLPTLRWLCIKCTILAKVKNTSVGSHLIPQYQPT